MKYKKPTLNFSQQANLLIDRGLVAEKEDLKDYLSRVNYYRFSGYLYPFRSGNEEKFIPGTTFDQVRNIYRFDSELRKITLAAIEVIEIAILRTRMVERFALDCGPFCYTEQSNYTSEHDEISHQKMLWIIGKSIERSDEIFVKKYRAKYKKEKNLPFWMVAEICSMSQLSIMFRDLPYSIQSPIAKELGLHSLDIVSWLHTLTVIRNICAHHARLWNRILPVRPKHPKKKYRPEFYIPNRINNGSYFIILAILEYLVKNLNPRQSFVKPFIELIEEFPEIPINKMGLPENWREYLIFK